MAKGLLLFLCFAVGVQFCCLLLNLAHFRILFRQAQLLLQMGQSMDQENLPQSFQSPRSFAPLRSLWTGGDACRFLTGREATFAVTVHFRRHSSWQGELLCRGEAHPRPFRSGLELIGLMDGAMEARRQAMQPPMLREDA